MDPVIALPPGDFPMDGPDVVVAQGQQISWENPVDLLEEFVRLTHGSAGQKIAILDTGLDYNHPLIKDRFDVKEMKDYTGSRTGPNDFNGHGTFVFYQIAQRCPNAEFYICKVLGDNGSGTSQGIASATRQCADWGCNYANASLGAGSSYAPMGEALAAFKGLFFAASGNSGGPRMGWPARWGTSKGVMPIGAYRQGGARADFSDYANTNELVCNGAGQNITSAKAQSQGLARGWNGTSMGTPDAMSKAIGHNSALLSMGRTDVSEEDARLELMQEACEDVAEPGRDPKTGFGNLTLERVLEVIRGVVNTPTLAILFSLLLAIPAMAQGPRSTIDYVDATVQTVENVSVDGQVVNSTVIKTVEKSVVSVTVDTPGAIVEAHFESAPFPPVRMQSINGDQYIADLKPGKWWIHVFGTADLSEWIPADVTGEPPTDPDDPGPPPSDDFLKRVAAEIAPTIPGDPETAEKLSEAYRSPLGDTPQVVFESTTSRQQRILLERAARDVSWAAFVDKLNALVVQQQMTVSDLKAFYLVIADALDLNAMTSQLPMTAPWSPPPGVPIVGQVHNGMVLIERQECTGTECVLIREWVPIPAQK